MAILFEELGRTISVLTDHNRGILAADESIGTISKRFAKVKVESTYESRRSYRELLFSSPSIENFISGVILFDETIRQSTSEGVPFTKYLENKGIITGIKVDKGTVPLPLSSGENYTEGLENLRDRLLEYKSLGARFAKWRAVFKISNNSPSHYCINANSHILAIYAAQCQEAGIVPIVEPEVLMDGNHSIDQCCDTTCNVLHNVFSCLLDSQVAIDYIILKPNMVLPGKDAQSKPEALVVAAKTLHALNLAVPSAVPAVAFLSGGQTPVEATQNLNALANFKMKPKPWTITFSFSRALQEQPMSIWSGHEENREKAQAAFIHRAKCIASACKGIYNDSAEKE